LFSALNFRAGPVFVFPPQPDSSMAQGALPLGIAGKDAMGDAFPH
jgi:hypothetical protein